MIAAQRERNGEEGEEAEENEKYDGPAQRDSLEYAKMVDPNLGFVPSERLWNAVDYTDQLRAANNYEDISLLWDERGPVFDSVGPSNGNGRGGGGGSTAGGYTSGRIAAVLIDTLNDPTGNTVICGGIAGGIWKCTNFLAAVPNWRNAGDYFSNLAISSICQDPSDPKTMYFSTGEATSNADAVYGKGIWKSTNGGDSWVQLGATLNYIRNFKILCDADGNIYLAARPTTTPAVQSAGLLRSKNGGLTWTNITPSGLTSTTATCTDIELSSTGRLHASFGYSTGSGVVNYRFASDPANVTSASGWDSAVTGIRITRPYVPANRLELAVLNDTVYGVTVSASNNIDSCYKSIDGGLNWTKQDTTAYTTGLGSSQGWYSVTLAINPDSSNQIMIGGLDAYKSVNSGFTISRATYWVTSRPYVHADHHFMEWFKAGGESRIVIGCDGGLFLSRDTGKTWIDRNRNLPIKQFYAAAIHPTDPNYLLAGAQDNGVHQLKNPGMSYSTEVTGGDGCFVHINQKNPNIQFGSYVYNQYRRSTNGGVSWSSFNLSSSLGMFVNPFDYDDDNNILYGSFGNNTVIRWNRADTGINLARTVRDTILINSLKRVAVNGSPSAFKVSPYTPNRVFIGANNGRLVILDHADTVKYAADSSVRDITGASFPSGFLNCVNTGTSDDFLVAVFTNYGINNVWFSSDRGTSWSAIDGNLPDMPVRWAVFQPKDNTKLIIATEAGVYTTQQINGASTVWMPSPGFPTVRTDMIKIRPTDYTMVAATHGRGLFTSNSFNLLPIRSIRLNGNLGDDDRSALTWNVQGDVSGKTSFDVQYSTDGIAFRKIADLGYPAAQYRHDAGNVPVRYYRIMAYEKGQGPVFSNIAVLRSNRISKGLQLSMSPNPVHTDARLSISGAGGGKYNWQITDLQGRMQQQGSGVLQANAVLTQPLNITRLPSGMYHIRIVQGTASKTIAFIKQ